MARSARGENSARGIRGPAVGVGSAHRSLLRSALDKALSRCSLPRPAARVDAYPPQLTLREARQRYFERNDLADGGYTDRWVRLKVGPLFICFPNTEARVRAVRLHDLHHVLTEYDTSWRGEAEIGAWEIAAGCGRYVAAWALNLGAIAVGLLAAPRAVYAAFLRGRKTANLYQRAFDAPSLERTVGEQRTLLRLNAPLRPTTAGDRLAFLGWASVSLAWMALPLSAVVWAVVALI